MKIILNSFIACVLCLLGFSELSLHLTSIRCSKLELLTHAAATACDWEALCARHSVPAAVPALAIAHSLCLLLHLAALRCFVRGS